MIHKQLCIGGILFFLAIGLVSCSILGEPVPGGQAVNGQIFTQAAQTVIAQLTPLPATQTAIATPPPPTITPVVNTALTPSPVLQPTETATLEAFTPPALVHANLITNCRAGPGVSYDPVGLLYPPEDVTLLGKSDPPGWWYIRNPPQRRRQPLSFCWVWSGSTTASGDLDKVPVVNPPS